MFYGSNMFTCIYLPYLLHFILKCFPKPFSQYFYLWTFYPKDSLWSMIDFNVALHSFNHIESSPCFHTWEK